MSLIKRPDQVSLTETWADTSPLRATAGDFRDTPAPSDPPAESDAAPGSVRAVCEVAGEEGGGGGSHATGAMERNGADTTRLHLYDLVSVGLYNTARQSG